jgi:hypothetical protein
VYGRNIGGSEEYIKNGISNRLTEIPEVTEAIWMGVRCSIISYAGLINKLL